MTLCTPTHMAAALLVSLAACQSAPSELTEADRMAIQEATDQFVQAVRAGDFATVASLYTEDARFMPPNQPTVTGREDIQEWMQAMPALTDFSLTNDQVTGRGDLAYVIGRYVLGLEGMPVDSGKFIEVRQRGTDGAWRIAADIFNSDLPAPGM